MSGATTPTLQSSVKSSHLGYKVAQLSLAYPHLPQCPPPHPSQIKPLSDFCFSNLWTLTEAPTLERETAQHGMISWWQGEAEKTFLGMSLLKPPDHPVIFPLVSLSLCLVASPSIAHPPCFNLIVLFLAVWHLPPSIELSLVDWVYWPYSKYRNGFSSLRDGPQLFRQGCPP